MKPKITFTVTEYDQDEVRVKARVKVYDDSGEVVERRLIAKARKMDKGRDPEKIREELMREIEREIEEL